MKKANRKTSTARKRPNAGRASALTIKTAGRVRQRLIEHLSDLKMKNLSDEKSLKSGRSFQEPTGHNLKISVSGIRGIIGEGLNPEVVTKYAAAFGTWANNGKIILGRDSRVSGDMVRNAVLAGLMATGCRIIDIGVVPTPTVEIAVKNLRAHGGIAITASHNPIEWNALKLIGPDGLFLNEPQAHEVIEIAHKNQLNYVSWDRLGKIEYYDHAVQNHLDHLLELEYIDIEKLKTRKFNVVVDCINGAGGILIPRLLKEIGCEVITINQDPHGIFPRNPEPVPENLLTLETAVREHHADIGFAIDPDADRMAVVSNAGNAIGEEYTIALAVDFILSQKKGPVVVNVSTTRAIDDIAAKYQCPVYRTKIGEIYVSNKMREVQAVIGGEGNGGVILPEIHYGRDAATGVLLILQHLCNLNQSVQELKNQLPAYIMKKHKIPVDLKKPFEKIKKRILSDYKKFSIDATDGIKINMPDGWVQLRESNTEPIIRLMLESQSEKWIANTISSFTSYFN